MKWSTKIVVEGGLCIALTYLLGWIAFWKMPQGGSIHAAHMVPLLFFALRRGAPIGIVAGMVFGALDFLLGEKYSLHPLSILLDYIIAYGAIGITGYAAGGTRWNAMAAALVAMVVRLAAMIVSGAVVFASYAPEGMNPWLYATMYNATTAVPDMVINLIVMGLLYRRMMALPK